MDRLRSLLFVPGHRERMVEKALALEGLDVALLDLEDGVPPSEKEEARRVVHEALAKPREGGPLRFVRVNRAGKADLERDVVAVRRPGLDGLLLSKVERPDEVTTVAQRVPRARLVAGIESARGLLAAPTIATASPRLVALMFGGEDFANDLGLPATLRAEAREMTYARSAIVVAAAAAGIAAVDGVWTDIADLDGLRRDSLSSRRLGFRGRSLIHPSHVAIVDEVFSPDAAEIEWAERVVRASAEAVRDGRSAIAVDGQLVDPPIVERARRVLREVDR